MCVKSTLNEEVFKDKGFPKLMISNVKDIVLFTSKRTGTVVFEGVFNRLGYYSDCWNIQSFKDYNGEITLKNE